MDGGVAARRPTGSHGEERAVIHFTDEHLVGIKLHLRVASQAQVSVTLGQHFLMNRPVRLMAGRATVLHALVDKNKRAGLLSVALSALLILARQSEPPGLLENLTAMGIMTVDTVHLSLQNGMMLGKTKLGVFLLVAVQAGLRIAAGIVNKHSLASSGDDVLASRAVA